MRKIVSMFLAMVMVFQLSVCCFADVNANSKVSNSLSISDCLNWNDFSADDHKLISGIISNPCEYLELSEIYNNMVVLIYKTNDYNTKIAITDGYVEIVKRLGENDFSINGVITQVWVRSADRSVMNKEVYQSGNTKDPSGWIETSYLDKAWVYHDYYYEDVYTQDPFVTYTVGALAALLGYVLTTNPITAFIWSIATILVSIALPWTKIARVHCYEYLDTVSSYPLLWYRKVDCRVMAYYNNVYTHAGDDVKYYFMNLV